VPWVGRVAEEQRATVTQVAPEREQRGGREREPPRLTALGAPDEERGVGEVEVDEARGGGLGRAEPEPVEQLEQSAVAQTTGAPDLGGAPPAGVEQRRLEERADRSAREEQRWTGVPDAGLDPFGGVGGEQPFRDEEHEEGSERGQLARDGRGPDLAGARGEVALEVGACDAHERAGREARERGAQEPQLERERGAGVAGAATRLREGLEGLRASQAPAHASIPSRGWRRSSSRRRSPGSSLR